MTAAWCVVLDGAMHGTAFLDHVETVLVLTLEPGDIAVMDNLPVHRSAAARDAICQAELRFLPPYSPDSTPIEMALEPASSGATPAPSRP